MHRHLIAGIFIACAFAPAFAQEKRAVAELIAELKKGDPEKLKAIEALDALGEKASDAAPALIGLLSHSTEDVRPASAMALGKIGPAAVEPLTAMLDRQY